MSFNVLKMQNPAVYDHPVSNIKLIETHISWVLLTGDYAYKIKKPVNFGFLDFSSLEKRRQFCEQEVLLNKRLAPGIYLDVVAIAGTPENPVISTKDKKGAFEFAVKMVQFPQSAQLDNRLAAGELKLDDMDAIAHMVADFHRSIPVAKSPYGDKEMICRPVEENFGHIDDLPLSKLNRSLLESLRKWSANECEKLAPVFKQRKRDGFIRECHGDMHLRNLVWLEDKPMAFDCIEFNPELRWIDVLSEVAFLVMDLQDRQQKQLANRFLNTYLEDTGDYLGLVVLPFYLCYRAMVRAKVDALRLAQNSIQPDERVQSFKEFESYLQLANSYTKASAPKLIIMRGMSASGKSTVSQQVLDELGAIRIRSDVERKRLFEVPKTASTSNGIEAGIYSVQASEQTYAKLAELATGVIRAGYTVIVDAAFLKYEQREAFQELAGKLNVSYIIMEVTASADVLRQRIKDRKNDVSDADLGVLEHQLQNWQPLQENEIKHAISVNTEHLLEVAVLLDKIKNL